MLNTPDTEGTFEPFEGKVPQTANLPNENTENKWQAREQNIVSNNILNAGVTSGVSVPTTPQESRAIDPLLLGKILQHKASFANNYVVDSVVTTTKHTIKLVSSEKGLDAKHIIIKQITPTPPQTIPYQAEVRNIINSVDAQPFDSLPNGAEFNFLITQDNTLSVIDISYEFKHLVYNVVTKQQESATVTLSYPLKDVSGTADIGVNTLKQNSRATIVFDKALQVFKLMSVSSGFVQSEQEYLFQATFLANEYTLDQSSNYTLPTVISNGFNGEFIAPATNTGSATFKIQKYDGTYHTTLTAKKYSGVSLVNLVANDLKQNQLYKFVIIGGELAVFGIQPDSLSIQAQKRIILSYNSPTVLNYSAGGFIFDDFTGSATVTAGTLTLTGLTANASWYVFGIYNPTTGVVQIEDYNSLTPTLPAGFTKKKLLFAFVTNATSQVRPFTMYADGYIEYVTPIEETTELFEANGVSRLKQLTLPVGLVHNATFHCYWADKKVAFVGSASQNIVITQARQGNMNVSENPPANFELISSQETTKRTNTNSQIWISTRNQTYIINVTMIAFTHGYTIIS